MSRARIPYAFAKNHGVMDIASEAHGVHLQVRAHVQAAALAEVQRMLGRIAHMETLSDTAFDQALSELYGAGQDQALAMMDDLEQDHDLSRLAQEMPEIEDLLEVEDDAPIIRLINALLTQALREHASDVHIEPFETRSVVRYRVDGRLRDVLEPRRGLHGALVSRIKVMANLDISEKRMPQDGRMSLRVAGRAVDVRVSTLPTGHGERVVLRLLEKQGQLDLGRLGLAADHLQQIRQLMAQPHGIFLVTGPTGSGKTTTLYAALSEMDARSTNIMTVEDPIEYDLDGVGQTQINTKIDMTFARALRAILRQDPDVIMIGEIRDLETAQIAVQASLTGHLVLATLHTNDAAAAVTRLVDMGIEPFLLASSLMGVLAQRLARTLCPQCRLSYQPDQETQALLPQARVWYQAQGCAECGFTGYRGRTGIHECLLVDEGLRSLIHERASEQKIRQYAVAQGMRGMREDGLLRVQSGLTTVEEVLRVTREH